MAEAQQIAQLVNYFLNHYQTALGHAFHKHVSSHWRNMSWNLFLKFLLPLAPSAQSLSSLVYWLYNSSIRSLSKRLKAHSPSVPSR